jgi:hypothetical protein
MMWVADDGGRAAAGFSGQAGDCVVVPPCSGAINVGAATALLAADSAIQTTSAKTRLITTETTTRAGVA